MARFSAVCSHELLLLLVSQVAASPEAHVLREDLQFLVGDNIDHGYEVFEQTRT